MGKWSKWGCSRNAKMFQFLKVCVRICSWTASFELSFVSDVYSPFLKKHFSGGGIRAERGFTGLPAMTTG
jgi:hypothetical protein